jgi:ABC-type branched-subunit amino acid transport system substrate-binding protein
MKATRSLLLALLGVLFHSALAIAEPSITYKIGAILPFSGAVAFAGEDIRKGLELAASQSTNIKFDFVYEDSQFNTKMAATAANLLVTRDHVDVLISLWDTAEPVAPIAERAKIPHLSIRWNPHVAEKNKYTFTVESTYKSYVASQLALLKKLGAKSAAIISQESEGWGLGYQYFIDNAKSYGIEVVSAQEYVPNTQDFKGIITKALSKKPDVVVLNSFVPDTQLLVTKIREVSPTQKITGYFDEESAKSLFEGMPYVSQFIASHWFEKMFIEKYGEPFKIRASQAYDIIKIIEHVHRGQLTKLSSDEFVAALKKIHGLAGASGDLSTHGGKTIESKCGWKVVRDGKVEIYQ